jgi:hypothetical protein
MTTIVGFDPGNSEATLTVAPGGPKGTSLTIPSHLGSGSLDELRRVRGGIGADGLVSGEQVLEFDGRSQFVGALALEQSADATSARGDIGRYWGGHTLRLLLTLAGALLRAEATVRIVTGLPVQVWSKETVRKVQQSLIGEHQYLLNGRPRVLVVEGCMVLMEGAGALAAHGLSEDVPQAVIDVGGRTTDLFWSQGMRPVLPRCAGLSVGVEKIGDQVGADFVRRHRRDLQPRELRGVLRSYATQTEGPPLFVNGQRVHLNGEVGTAAASVGAEIASFVAQTWRSSEQGAVAADAARVLLIGGGAHYVTPQLRGVIPHLEIPKQPELANAQGYLAVGLQIPEAAWARLRGA